MNVKKTTPWDSERSRKITTEGYDCSGPRLC